MKKILFLIILSIISLNVLTVHAQGVTQCTQLKMTTLPLAGDYGNFGQFTVTRQTIPNPDPNAPAPISVFVPNNATAQTRVPVVFFAHGFGGVDYRFYEKLMRQLSSNGYIVVFSPYTASIFTTHAARYNQLWNGFLTAAGQYGNIMDTSRVGFAGHSYGAGATPEMARRGVTQGWGANGLFLFVMAAWYNWGTNLNQIPASAKMVVQVYWDERKWQVIRASQTFCSLGAGHSVPVTDGLGQTNGATDAYDYWGVWRRLHALSDYTFTGNQPARNVAFGVDSFMGRWRGVFGVRRISPLESTDAPVLNANIDADWKWANKCAVADFGTSCP
jgi:Chlorophyllase enzyme